MSIKRGRPYGEDDWVGSPGQTGLEQKDTILEQKKTNVTKGESAA